MFKEMLEILSDTGFRENEKNQALCQSLVSKNFIRLKDKTKKTYILSSKGRKILQNISPYPTFIESKQNYSLYLTFIQKEFSKLRSAYRPFVKIQDLKNRLVINKKVIPKHLFEETLLWLHNKGDITLETGFTKNEAEKNGLQAKNGKYYQYLIDISS